MKSVDGNLFLFHYLSFILYILNLDIFLAGYYTIIFLGYSFFETGSVDFIYYYIGFS